MHMSVPRGVMYVTLDAQVLIRVGVFVCIGWMLTKCAAEFVRWIVENLWTCELRVHRRREEDQEVSIVVHPVAVARAGYELEKSDGA